MTDCPHDRGYSPAGSDTNKEEIQEQGKTDILCYRLAGFSA